MPTTRPAFTNPNFSSGPFCTVRFYRMPDGEVQTYTYGNGRGDALVQGPYERVNTLGTPSLPTWRLLRS